MNTWNIKISKENLKLLKTKVGHVVIFCDEHIDDQSTTYLEWIDKQPLSDFDYEQIAIDTQQYWITELKCCQRLLITDETMLNEIILKTLKLNEQILDLN